MEFTHSVVARSTRSSLAKALCILLVFLPFVGTSVQAQSSLPGLGTSDAVFESYGGGLAVEADNGFDVSVVNGEWRHDGHRHIGGTGRIASPWGEQMPIRYWFNTDGSFAVEYDGNALLHYQFDDLGGLGDLTAVTEQGLHTVYAGQRAQGAALGTIDPLTLDLGPYEAFLGQIVRNHTRGFLEGAGALSARFEQTGAAAPASCFTDILTCTAAIIGWIGTVPAIAAGCSAGAALTLGAGCLAAIIGHEAASLATIAACTAAIEECTEQDSQHGDPGDGCNGPDGGPE